MAPFMAGVWRALGLHTQLSPSNAGHRGQLVCEVVRGRRAPRLMSCADPNRRFFRTPAGGDACVWRTSFRVLFPPLLPQHFSDHAALL